MPSTFKRFFGPAHLAGTATTLLTVPGSTKYILRHIHVSNGHTSPVGFTFSIGVDAISTRLYDAFELESKQVIDWTGLIVLEAADTIQAFGSVASKLTMTISGVEET